MENYLIFRGLLLFFGKTSSLLLGFPYAHYFGFLAYLKRVSKPLPSGIGELSMEEEEEAAV